MFQPRRVTFPNMELEACAYLRGLNPGVFVSRVAPTLPLTVAGTTYQRAIIVRNDSGPSDGPLATRRLGVRVLGARDVDLSATVDLAEAVAADLRVWALAAGRVVRVDAVRGPWIVSDVAAAPELYLTAEATLFGFTE